MAAPGTSTSTSSAGASSSSAWAANTNPRTAAASPPHPASVLTTGAPPSSSSTTIASTSATAPAYAYPYMSVRPLPQPQPQSPPSQSAQPREQQQQQQGSASPPSSSSLYPPRAYPASSASYDAFSYSDKNRIASSSPDAFPSTSTSTSTATPAPPPQAAAAAAPSTTTSSSYANDGSQQRAASFTSNSSSRLSSAASPPPSSSRMNEDTFVAHSRSGSSLASPTHSASSSSAMNASLGVDEGPASSASTRRRDRSPSRTAGGAGGALSRAGAYGRHHGRHHHSQQASNGSSSTSHAAAGAEHSNSSSSSSNVATAQPLADRTFCTASADLDTFVLVDLSGLSSAAAVRERVLARLRVPDDDFFACAFHTTRIGNGDGGPRVDDAQLWDACERVARGEWPDLALYVEQVPFTSPQSASVQSFNAGNHQHRNAASAPLPSPSAPSAARLPPPPAPGSSNESGSARSPPPPLEFEFSSAADMSHQRERLYATAAGARPGASTTRRESSHSVNSAAAPTPLSSSSSPSTRDENRDQQDPGAAAAASRRESAEWARHGSLTPSIGTSTFDDGASTLGATSTIGPTSSRQRAGSTSTIEPYGQQQASWQYPYSQYGSYQPYSTQQQQQHNLYHGYQHQLMGHQQPSSPHAYVRPLPPIGAGNSPPSQQNAFGSPGSYEYDYAGTTHDRQRAASSGSHSSTPYSNVRPLPPIEPRQGTNTVQPPPLPSQQQGSGSGPQYHNLMTQTQYMTQPAGSAIVPATTGSVPRLAGSRSALDMRNSFERPDAQGGVPVRPPPAPLVPPAGTAILRGGTYTPGMPPPQPPPPPSVYGPSGPRATLAPLTTSALPPHAPSAPPLSGGGGSHGGSNSGSIGGASSHNSFGGGGTTTNVSALFASPQSAASESSSASFAPLYHPSISSSIQQHKQSQERSPPTSAPLSPASTYANDMPTRGGHSAKISISDMAGSAMELQQRREMQQQQQRESPRSPHMHDGAFHLASAPPDDEQPYAGLAPEDHAHRHHGRGSPTSLRSPSSARSSTSASGPLTPATDPAARADDMGAFKMTGMRHGLPATEDEAGATLWATPMRPSTVSQQPQHEERTPPMHRQRSAPAQTAPVAAAEQRPWAPNSNLMQRALAAGDGNTLESTLVPSHGGTLVANDDSYASRTFDDDDDEGDGTLWNVRPQTTPLMASPREGGGARRDRPALKLTIDQPSADDGGGGGPTSKSPSYTSDSAASETIPATGSTSRRRDKLRRAVAHAVGASSDELPTSTSMAATSSGEPRHTSPRHTSPLSRRKSFKPNESDWAFRPPVEQVYENLEDFFPDHDLDKPIVEAAPTPVHERPAHNTEVALASSMVQREQLAQNALRYKKSIRRVALDRKRTLQHAGDMLSGAAGRIIDRANVALSRRKSTKLWGNRIEEVTPAQAKLMSVSSTSGGVAPDSSPVQADADYFSFKWVKGELIGRGTYGQVFLALNVTTGDMLAVKQVELPKTRSDREDARQQGMVASLKAEIELLKDLDHPKIVQYLGFEESASHLSIFLEYVPGGSVGRIIQKHGKFEENVIKSFIRQILEGLEYLHGLGILHRDMKADNILCDHSGNCKISDFGTSRKSQLDPYSDAEMSIQGSVFWMAPEVVFSKSGYSAKADIWSLGCICLEMWAGKRPWSDQQMFQAMYKLGMERAVPPLPENVRLSEVSDHFLHECLKVEPERRPTATQLRRHVFLELPATYSFKHTALFRAISTSRAVQA